MSAIIIIGYAYMIGAGFSTRRAVIMFLISMFATVVGRTYDIVSSLSLAAIFILSDNPFAIYNTGFLLSFMAIIGICPVSECIIKFLDTENKLINYIVKSLVSSIFINMILLPVIINEYSEISLYSPIVNIIVVAFAGIMVLLGFFGLLLSFINLKIGKIIIYFGCKILYLYEVICKLIKNLPWNTLIVSERSILRVVMYYVILSIFLIIIYICNGKKILKTIYRYIFVVISVSAMLCIIIYTKCPMMEVKMISVGQGDSIYMRIEDKNILIDAGSSSENNITEYTILPFLKNNGVNSIDYLFVTHSDSDHMNGVYQLLEYKINKENYVKKLILPDIDDGLKDEQYKELENIAKKQKINVMYFSKGNAINIDNTYIKCLWPIKNAGGIDKNGQSLVLKIKNEKISILFTGDLTKESEKMIVLKEGSEIENVDILKVAHHGSNDSTCEEFLNIVNPKIALISCGENNNYGHPGEETLERMIALGTKIYRTDDDGGITITIESDEIRIKKMLETN